MHHFGPAALRLALSGSIRPAASPGFIPPGKTRKEGGGINFGAAFDVHSAMVSLTQYHDNVDDDALYARTDSSQGQIQYMFTKFASLPMGLMYQRSEINSTDEPEYAPHLENTTDAVSATINYMRGAWNFGFQAGFSNQNDKTAQDYDTDAVNYALSSTYYSEYVAVSPSVSFMRSRYRPTGTRNDTYTTTTRDLRGNLWDQRISYECAGTFSRTESSDDAMKEESGEIRSIDPVFPKDQTELSYAPLAFKWQPVSWAETYLIVFTDKTDEKPKGISGGLPIGTERRRGDADYPRLKTSLKNRPVWDFSIRATSSGVPQATISPPWSPPSGPRSIT